MSKAAAKTPHLKNEFRLFLNAEKRIEKLVPGSEIVGSSGIEKSTNMKIKREETGERKRGRACNHFFKRLVTVY